MIQSVTVFNKKVTIIHNGGEENNLVTTIMSLVFEMKEDYVIFLVYFDEDRAYVHFKPFDKEVEFDTAIKEIKEELDSDITVYSGKEYIIKKTGCHPREFYKKLLRDENL